MRETISNSSFPYPNELFSHRKNHGAEICVYIYFLHGYAPLSPTIGYRRYLFPIFTDAKQLLRWQIRIRGSNFFCWCFNFLVSKSILSVQYTYCLKNILSVVVLCNVMLIKYEICFYGDKIFSATTFTTKTHKLQQSKDTADEPGKIVGALFSKIKNICFFKFS